MRRLLLLLLVALLPARLLAAAPPRATVYVFLAPTCPISQAAALELRKLHSRYGAQVAFIGLFPDPKVTAAERAEFARAYQLPFPLRSDAAHVLTRRFGATITPEVVVVDPEGHPLYQGRIDDQYLALGQRRTVVLHHELADALSALVAGRPVAVAHAPAVGCLIENP